MQEIAHEARTAEGARKFRLPRLLNSMITARAEESVGATNFTYLRLHWAMSLRSWAGQFANTANPLIPAVGSTIAIRSERAET